MTTFRCPKCGTRTIADSAWSGFKSVSFSCDICGHKSPKLKPGKADPDFKVETWSYYKPVKYQMESRDPDEPIADIPGLFLNPGDAALAGLDYLGWKLEAIDA
jgi:hypothetical protein